ncbi:MAG: hypothetical protein GY749_50540 [Desulfobacteraceae bacterium]|nr:hypothetical protein [Desulfobacteraceae bacterium]
MKKILTTALLVTGMLLFYANPPAFSFPPDNGFKIVSESISPGISSAAASSRTWEVIPAVSSDGSRVLKFLTDKASRVSEPFCTLKINMSSGKVEYRETGKRRKKTGTKNLLIMSGYPAPCDILPVSQEESEKTYEEKYEAGGRVFVRKYKVKSENVSLEHAVKNGWIRKDSSIKPAGLRMITVTNRQGRLEVKQLWPAEGTWWIYEETPYRRSWLVY